MSQQILNITCSACKKIFGKEELWKLSSDIESNTTHAICPECTKKLYPELYDQDQNTDDKGEHFFDFLP